MAITWFHSVRFRLLLPVTLVALLAACGVGLFSFFWGKQIAQQDVRSRFLSIRDALSDATYPLTGNVVDSLASLTGSQLISFSSNEVQESSLDLTVPSREALEDLQRGIGNGRASADEPHSVRIEDQKYLRFIASVQQANSATSLQVWILFEEDRLVAASRRAAMLPLLTGLSTILALAVVMLWLAHRLSRRISLLESRVASVAGGDFNIQCGDLSQDEVGRLGQAVDSMGTQLKRLWNEVNQQQSAKLLHQIAGGMAHQLRNTLTGTKMAIELHARSVENECEELEVALQQIRLAEDYVTRLLLVGRGEQADLKPGRVVDCFSNLHSNIGTMARHLNRELGWEIAEEAIGNRQVLDVNSFQAAVSNLLINAIQAAESVKLEAFVADRSSIIEDDAKDGGLEELVVVVSDNGPGISDAVCEDLFKPFVTTKPEGMGLGLPLVKRSAEQLQGRVEWTRASGWTHFEFRCKLYSQ